MRRFAFSSLKTRLYVLVLVTVMPLWVLILYTNAEHRRIELKNIEQNTLKLAEATANAETQLVEGARHILIAVGNFLKTTHFASPACESFCAGLLTQFTRYANIGAVYPDGTVLCSGVPLTSPVGASDREWFQQALKSRDIVIGGYHMGRITEKPVVVMAHSIVGPQDQISAVVFAAIDIDWLNRFTLGWENRLPRDAMLDQMDENGVLLSYRPDQHAWQSGAAKRHPLLGQMVSMKRGVLQGSDGDGRPFIYAFAPLRSALKDREVFMVLSIPKDTAFAESNRLLLRNLVLLAVVTLLAMLLAHFASHYFVLQHVDVLVDASRKLAAGDLTARIGPPHQKGELGQLAKAFDEMASALEKKAGEQKLAENELRRSREELRDLTAYIQTVREKERTRIARDIHDNLGQALTALKMDVAWLKKRDPETLPAFIKKTESMDALIQDTIQTVQRVSAELRPGILDDFGLIAAIEWQSEEFQQRTGIKTTLSLSETPMDISKDQSTAVFRIFQEALTNVIRHSNASEIKVELSVDNNSLVLIIEDNGRGITEEEISHSKSFGLKGMRERVYPWNGDVLFQGRPHQGTTVTVMLPLDGKET